MMRGNAGKFLIAGVAILVLCVSFLYVSKGGSVKYIYTFNGGLPGISDDPPKMKITDSTAVAFQSQNKNNDEAFVDCRGRKQKLLSTVFSRDETAWHRNTEVCSKCFDFARGNLKTPNGQTPIFVYNRNKDIWVSGSLLDRGTFESEKATVIYSFLNADPTLNLIDFGANVGVYTLSIAKMGRKVLAVEALNQNIQHICASIMEGNLHNNTYLIYNAISNGHTVVNLGVDKNNMGGTFVDVDSDHIKKLKAGRAQGTYGQVHTITLDDLIDLPMINMFPKVIVKMDVEGFEAKALEKAYNFFKKIKIVAFVMEWEFHKGMASANSIIKFMKEHNFKPHALNARRTLLDFARNASWGYDVLWMPS